MGPKLDMAGFYPHGITAKIKVPTRMNSHLEDLGEHFQAHSDRW